MTTYLDTKNWRKKYPDRIHAHRIVYIAKRNGSMIQQPCYCGNHKSEAHHWDYSEPGIVSWYCKKHHVQMDEIHKLLNKISQYENTNKKTT